MTNPSDPTEDLPDLRLNKRLAAAALSQPARRLHQHLLTSFAQTGHAPTRQQLNRMAHDLGIEPDSAIDELVTRDVLALDDHGEIRAAYPFSPTPTRHILTWVNGPNTYAMCAIDALGMSAMLDRPVTITSTEPETDKTITVEVDRREARWSPSSAIVLAAATTDTCCPSVDRTCSYINFFTSTTAAATWQAAHPHITGPVLDQKDALAFAIDEFGGFLHSRTT